MADKPKLNVEDILKAEFEYIAHTAFQANEDRARVSSFYFVSVGSVVAAILERAVRCRQPEERRHSLRFPVPGHDRIGRAHHGAAGAPAGRLA